MDYQPFLKSLHERGFDEWAQALPPIIAAGLNTKRYGDLPRWQQALSELPTLTNVKATLDSSRVTLSQTSATGSANTKAPSLGNTLQKLHPWRKGPFDLFGTHIDTEWRSDWKWDRVQPHITPLDGRHVLDIGCGSGYHCWRMRGAGADLVVGIEPTPLFICQFFAIQNFIRDAQVGVLPMGIEKLPSKMRAFDSVFSMGILYHRRSPMDHLLQLRDTLKPGGELILETLVIEGGLGDTLVPEGRYGKMGNVWFIPSSKTLISWLTKMGFENVRLVDETVTTTEEQRATDWMRFQSLSDFLNPEDASKTIEGYPAPRRAVILANAL